MAEDHGVFDDEGTDSAVLPVMDIAAADAGELDVDNDIVRVGDGWDGAVFEFDGVRLLEHEGEVLLGRGGSVSVAFQLIHLGN